MRKYDVAYVPNGPVQYYPSVPLQEMSLEEIKKKYLKTCAISNGSLSACSKCSSPCPEGKRAIQLAANEIYNDPPIPLYGGKTLIERAKEENMKRRAEKEMTEVKEIAEVKATTEEVGEAKEPKQKKKRIIIEGWYEKANATDDPVKWVMDAYGISKTKAKQRIYNYVFRHPEVKNAKDTKVENNVEVIEADFKQVEVKENMSTNVIESKLEQLMRKQEEHKKAMAEYMKLYEKEKEAYEKIKLKIDTLCNAMDIINDI